MHELCFKKHLSDIAGDAAKWFLVYAILCQQHYWYYLIFSFHIFLQKFSAAGAFAK